MTRRRLPLIPLALLCARLLPAAGTSPLGFSPPEWKYGMITQGAVIQASITVTSAAGAALTVTFVPTCVCLSVEPSSGTIPAGGRGTFLLRYDSAEDTGITARSFLVRTSRSEDEPLHYWLRGVVREDNPSLSAAAPGTETGSARDPAVSVVTASEGGRVGAGVTLSYYYTPGCRSCEEFLSREIPRLQKELGVALAVQRKDVLVPAFYAELASFASSTGQSVRAIPALRVGGVLLQGDGEIRQRLASLLSAAAGSTSVSPAPTTASSSGFPVVPAAAAVADRIAVLPVGAAGLIDGINPCAFTTLIFLLAALALGGRARREVLLIGALFSLAVFFTYFSIGLGLFAALRAAAAVSLVSIILRWVLVAVLAMFAGLSVYDYVLIRRGRPTEIVLQLPSALKKRIHSSIRTTARTAALAGSSLVLGFLVSIFEFACTGQVYLPVLAYLVRARGHADAVGLLLLYNLCFVAPLLAVFGASYLGVSSGRITTLFQRNMGKVKLALAVVFAGLAVVTLVQ